MGRGADEGERRAGILRYWRAVEYFSPPRVETPDAKKGVYAVRDGVPLPWERSPRPKPGNVWRHLVYTGVFESSKMRDVLREALGAKDDEDFDARGGGQSAMLCFTVNEAGFLLRESATLSTCAWAVGRTVTQGPTAEDWLDGFDEREQEILGFLFEYGDGRIPLATGSGTARSALGAVAGLTTRVAFDTLTGGLASSAASLGEVLSAAAERRVVAAVGEASTNGGGEQTVGESFSGLGTKALNLDDLAAITRYVAEELGIADALAPDVIRVKSYQVPIRSADDVKGEEFLNSFYADELGRVAAQVRDGTIGAVLRAYLSPDSDVGIDGRIDLRREPLQMLRSLAPVRMPAGRWPTTAEHLLTASQQFAVNEVMNGLGGPTERGLYAVNGPPGTGKTTMLRDLIAAVVVERAARLARFGSARQAFGSSPLTWRTGEDSNGQRWKMSIFPLKEELTGQEIVVASSNNGAVENISLEIPGVAAVDRASFPAAEYFAEPATAVAGAPAWGAIAARLGRRSFRSDFVEGMWWGASKGSGADALRGLDTLLKECCAELEAGTSDPEQIWRESVAAFETARTRVERLRRERQEVADLLDQLRAPDAIVTRLAEEATSLQEFELRLGNRRNELERQVDGARNRHLEACRAMTDAQLAVRTATAALDAAMAQVDHAERTLRTHEGGKPGFLRRWVDRRSGDDWTESSRPLRVAFEAALAAMSHADSEHAAREAELRVQQRRAEQAAFEVRDLQARIARCDREIAANAAARSANEDRRRVRQEYRRALIERVEEARRNWPGAVPGEDWDATPDNRVAVERRELSSPWMDAEFATARSELFLAALHLHRAALTADPDRARRSLRAVMAVVRGDVPTDLPERALLAAWQLLFFVVPVVSTTFASLGRMFAGLGRESFGWLFIDEAGQAAPHEAVGALWRARRAVVVGDPRQLEPVLTLPWTGQRRLVRRFGVDAQWVPQGLSVQTVSDRLNRFGTWLPDLDGLDQTWVGSPLRVHRRCDRLMFDVSNEIAYDNMMVYGVAGRDDDFDLLRSNTWLDVHAERSGSKWNPRDGSYLLATLNRVRERVRETMLAELASAPAGALDWAADERSLVIELKRRVAEAVFIVSPFKDVVRELEKTVGNRLPSSPRRVGTVHTTQGKEADIVVLVLGTATDQRGSRNWAAKRPNLLNVAVTRARRRLVVIGDYANWSGQRNFHALARRGSADGSTMLNVVDVEESWQLTGREQLVDWDTFRG